MSNFTFKINIMREILAICILIFLFWGTPDNWDKLDSIIDKIYMEKQYG